MKLVLPAPARSSSSCTKKKSSSNIQSIESIDSLFAIGSGRWPKDVCYGALRRCTNNINDAICLLSNLYTMVDSNKIISADQVIYKNAIDELSSLGKRKRTISGRSSQ